MPPRIRRSAVGHGTTHTLASIRFKNMSIQIDVNERGMSPRDITQTMIDTYLRYMRKMAQLMVYSARSLAPTSHSDGQYHRGSLTDSIIYTIKPARGGTLAFTIGVDADRWQSDYDERFAQAYGGKPPWGTLKNNKNYLLYLLHEYWTIFADRMEARSGYRDKHGGFNKMGERTAKERAEIKQTSNNYYPEVSKYIKGISVGEKFLYKGVLMVWTFAPKYLHGGTAKRLFSSVFPEFKHGNQEKASAGNVSRARMLSVFDSQDVSMPYIPLEGLTNVFSQNISNSWLPTTYARETSKNKPQPKPSVYQPQTRTIGEIFGDSLSIH